MSLFLRLSPKFLPAILFSIIAVLASVTGTAQSRYIFTPAAVDEQSLISLTANFEKRYRDETSKLPPENKKDILEIYKEQWNQVEQRFNRKEIYTSARAQQYLDALVAEIKNRNPVLQPLSFNTFFSRSGIPNASYIGEGIIVFHMGLFNKLENESQAAFILCHEIAHFYLQHTHKSINRYVTMLNSDEVQKELKKIKNTEYKKRSELEKFLKGFAFNSSRHSRDHESEADSMALEFMRHTRFDISESLTALALLDSIDADNFKPNEYLEKIFNAKEYPFQKKWIAKPTGLLGGHAQLEIDKELSDSLKTHPDCQLRIQMLQPGVKQRNSTETKNIIDGSMFNDLKRTFNYEIVEYSFASGNLTKSLFYTLPLLKDNPSDPYLVTHIGKIFNNFYTAQKAHTLSKSIDLPSPYFPAGYNQVLQFIQNLYLSDFSQISYNFLKQYSSSLDYYSPFKNVYQTSIQIAQ